MCPRRVGAAAGGLARLGLTAPVLEQTYRYLFPSSLVGDGDRRRLRLATSGGPAPNPRFFRGRLLLPVVAADLLLTLGDVARARFHMPAQMLKRILELADPVATCADDRLRFEAFSACCSVYGRVDLLPGAFDGEILGRGTTNVDIGPRIRTALAGVQERSELGLSIGASELEVIADGGSAVERSVPLPSRSRATLGPCPFRPPRQSSPNRAGRCTSSLAGRAATGTSSRSATSTPERNRPSLLDVASGKSP